MPVKPERRFAGLLLRPQSNGPPYLLPIGLFPTREDAEREVAAWRRPGHGDEAIIYDRTDMFFCRECMRVVPEGERFTPAPAALGFDPDDREAPRRIVCLACARAAP